MTYAEEKELLELTRENNQLLKEIFHCVHRDETRDFIADIFANIIGNRLDGGGRYAQRS